MKRCVRILIEIIVVIIVCMLISLIKKKNEIITENQDFIYIVNRFHGDILDKKNYVFTNYDDFYNIFHSDKLKENDFEYNNYVLVPVLYNACSDYDVTPTDYTIKGNNIDVIVKYRVGCGYCAEEYMIYLLKVDKSLNIARVNIDYKSVSYSCKE